jgi:hypothetical protein
MIKPEKWNIKKLTRFKKSYTLSSIECAFGESCRILRVLEERWGSGQGGWTDVRGNVS